MEYLYAPDEFWDATEDERDQHCNGCGPGGIGDWLVPDTIYGLNVRPACRIHDWMYAHGETLHDKIDADNVFLNNLVRIIMNHGGWLKVPRLLRANVMYFAVKRFGGPFFWVVKEPEQKLEIEKTEWAKNFRKNNRLQYKEAIDLATKPDFSVHLIENKETGRWLWSVVAAEKPEFWMDSFRTRLEAESFCEKMGWTIDEVCEAKERKDITL